MILDPGPGRLCYNYRIQHPKLRGFLFLDPDALQPCLTLVNFSLVYLKMQGRNTLSMSNQPKRPFCSVQKKMVKQLSTCPKEEVKNKSAVIWIRIPYVVIQMRIQKVKKRFEKKNLTKFIWKIFKNFCMISINLSRNFFSSNFQHILTAVFLARRSLIKHGSSH